MIRRCAEHGLQEPGFSYRDGFVTTIWRLPLENAPNGDAVSGKMPGKTEGKTEGKRLGRTARKILQLIQKNPQVTIPEMATSLGVTESAVKKQIRNLREQEIIGRIGPAKGGRWEVLE